MSDAPAPDFVPHSPEAELASIRLATDMDETVACAIWKTNGGAIETLSSALHLRVSTLPQPLLRPLSTRQPEVLEWSSQRKTVQDIATIMAVEATTVEKAPAPRARR